MSFRHVGCNGLKPLVLWACHSVTLISSASVAPLARAISSSTFAPLLSARGVAVSLVRAAFGAFLAAVAVFFGAAPTLSNAPATQIQPSAYD